MDCNQVDRNESKELICLIGFVEAALEWIESLVPGEGMSEYIDIQDNFTGNSMNHCVYRKRNYSTLVYPILQDSFAQRSVVHECIQVLLDANILQIPNINNEAGEMSTDIPIEYIYYMLICRPMLPMVLRLIDITGTTQPCIDDIRFECQHFIECQLAAHVTANATIPLINFIADDAPLPIGKHFVITRLTDEQKDNIWRLTGQDTNVNDLKDATFALSGSFIRSKSEPYDFGAEYRECKMIIYALRLLKPGAIGALYYSENVEDPYHPLRGGSSPLSSCEPARSDPVFRNISHQYQLSSKDIPQVGQLISNLNHPKVYDELNIALSRFNQAYSRTSPDDKIIDLTIALESTLLHKTRDELRYKLGLRGACLLRKTCNPPEIFRRLQLMYDVRSKIVHEGFTLGSKGFLKIMGSSEPDDVQICEDITRNVLRTYIDQITEEKNMKQINEELDDHLKECIADPNPIVYITS